MGIMVKNGIRKMGFTNPEVRILHPILDPNDHDRDPHEIHPGSSDEGFPGTNSQRDGREGSNRNRSNSKSGLMQPDISGPKY
jgi:hypothetical protein